MTKSAYTLNEVSQRLHRSLDQVKQDIKSGTLSYSIIEGQQMITLYDLQRYESWIKRVSKGFFTANGSSHLESVDINPTER